MVNQKKNKKKHYVLKADPGKYKIDGKPVRLIHETTKMLKNPKNIALSLLGIVFVSLIGFILGGIMGVIVAFVISIILLLLIGPIKVIIIERNIR